MFALDGGFNPSNFDQSIGITFALLLAVCRHLRRERFNSSLCENSKQRNKNVGQREIFISLESKPTQTLS